MYRIILLGSGELARCVLLGLLGSEHDIIGVLPWEKAQAVRWKARIKRLVVPDTMALVQRHKLSLLSARRANTEMFLREVRQLQPDILLVAGWGEVLKPEVIALPNLACVNVHPSLLPRHRGSNPISSVLCAGEVTTGVSFHYLNQKVDGGDILLQSEIAIGPSETADSLTRRIAFRAREAVADALANIQREGFTPRVQDESQAQYIQRLPSGETLLDWRESALSLHNRIRGYNPGRRCYIRHNQQKLYVLSAEVVALHRRCDNPGEVLHASGTQMVVATGDPYQALWLKHMHCPKSFGNIRAKAYVARSVCSGDHLG